jgi:hypothetical protein
LASVRQLDENCRRTWERMVALGEYVVVGLPPASNRRANHAVWHHPSGVRPRMATSTSDLGRQRSSASRPTEDQVMAGTGCSGQLTVHTVPGDHLTMFLEPNVDAGGKLAAELERVDGVVPLPQPSESDWAYNSLGESFGDSSGTSACRSNIVTDRVPMDLGGARLPTS